ncbi:PREDICTED: uncharacterized protein LOC108558845 [Nicrophorus vespilloides]|uniref:Uncharacterized protein LOC108558845 n=1 Tax=Nicrophorus vespilloides TaxID=110193 RepID=A0ABM1M9W5_NICVS|nr:PREDICTED: uncharacterized protein LOC108558845 [Nicrophorus vespilloides]
MFVCTSINNEDYVNIVNKKINTEDFKILSYNVAPMAKKSGIFGEHYFLKIVVKLENDSIEELSYFLKTLPQLESQKNFTLEMGAFFKEEQMFKLFVPLFLKNEIDNFSKCSPRCYLSQPDTMLIFEDLAIKGYKCLNARQSYDINLVKLAIRSMANLHASSIILEDMKSRNYGKNWRLYDEYPKQFQEMLYCQKPPSLALIESCVKGTTTQIDYLMGDHFQSKPELQSFKEFSRSSVRDLVKYVRPSEEFRNTICHGDLWAANIMFKFGKDGDPVDCLLVDFQSYRYCPPAQDLLTFIYLATDREFRSNHMQEVLRYYYEEFSHLLAVRGVKNIFDYEEFMASCEANELFAIIQSVTHFQIVMMSPDTMTDFLADSEYSRKCMFEDRSDNIIRVCELDKFYKAKQIESLTDLHEFYRK